MKIVAKSSSYVNLATLVCAMGSWVQWGDLNVLALLNLGLAIRSVVPTQTARSSLKVRRAQDHLKKHHTGKAVGLAEGHEQRFTKCQLGCAVTISGEPYHHACCLSSARQNQGDFRCVSPRAEVHAA